MKYIAILLLVLLVESVSAKCWRVNNNMSISADFRNISDAQVAATSGDTIYLEPSLKCYDGFTWTKKLLIIGSGYFLSENNLAQYSNLTSQVCGNITFNKGCEGSEMTGITLSNNTLIIKTGNLVIYRNLINTISFPYQNGITLNNIFITQNYIYYLCGGENYSDNFFVDGLVFSNNILVNNFDFVYRKYQSDCACYSEAMHALCTNNIFGGQVNLSSSIFRNNIFTKLISQVISLDITGTIQLKKILSLKFYLGLIQLITILIRVM
jgi:hypothetical protein